MKNFFYLIMGFLSFLLWGSCSSGDEAEDEPLYMPIHLYVAVGEGGPTGRTPGDPGMPENYQLPRYLYAYFVQKEAGTAPAVHSMTVVKEKLDPRLWKEVPNPNMKGLFAYEGNLLMFLSKKNIEATNLSGIETEESRVYAITSYDPLVFDEPKSCSEVPNLQLDLAKNPSDLDLLNVYANPLGEPSHTNGAVTKKGKFLYETQLTCYHVAARIDIQWDINPDLHDTYKLKDIQLNDVPQKGYFFKHTQNVETPGHTLTMGKITPGNQWFGRHVFYAFDTKEVDCSYWLDKKGAETSQKIDKTYNSPTQGTASAVFSSWYRINAALGY